MTQAKASGCGEANTSRARRKVAAMRTASAPTPSSRAAQATGPSKVGPGSWERAWPGVEAIVIVQLCLARALLQEQWEARSL